MLGEFHRIFEKTAINDDTVNSFLRLVGMQLNGTAGTVTMAAASEPPEPPPRNPDKINASLKQLAESKTRSLDTAANDKAAGASNAGTGSASNGGRPFRPLLSLDSNAKPTKPFDATDRGTPTSAPATGFGGSEAATPADLTPAGQRQSNQPPHSSTSSSSSSGETGQMGANGMVGLGEVGTSPPKPSTSSSSSSQGLANLDKANPTSGQQAARQISPTGNTAIGASDGDNLFKNGVTDLESPQTTKIRLENERLSAEITRLKKLLENSPDGAVGGIEMFSDNNSFDAHSTDDSSSRVEKLENELRISKELIQSLKLERKKLRADKNDLLSQVKQLCSSLQEKEAELRNFIRNYEQRIRESESNSAKQSTDRERERWSLLKHARDEAERSIALAAQLNARDLQLQRTQEQLQEARRQLSGCLSDQESLVSATAPLTPPSGLMVHNPVSGGSGGGVSGGGVGSGGYGNISGTPGDRGSCSADSGVRDFIAGSSDRESAAGDLNLSDGPCENGPCIQVDSDSVSLVSSHHNVYQYGTPKERSPTLSPLNAGAYSRSVDSAALSSSYRSVEQLGSPVDNENQTFARRLQQQHSASGPSTASVSSAKAQASGLTGRTGRGGTWGSISRVFARSRNRSKNAPIDTEASDFQWSPLTEEGYAEKLRLLREASSMPMERWRASQVLAWLEVALGMPQYSGRCAENVKSGKVLLELSDAELETGLGTSHPMHRKKLRLAIEEQRRPELVRYPTIGQLGHTWVASEWLPDIGLPQYSESFMHSLVDARMLDTLSKKELEKYLGVTRKFHQASIVHGIHVLRIMKYDRQAIAMRRLQSENVDTDPIVWTNQRFIRWARSIDLGEYAENLKDSGVHGGLVVLEPSFSGDTMATALGIPPSKNIIRRHLVTEFDALILPARATLGQGIRTGGGTVIPISSGIGMMTPGASASGVDRRNTGSLRFAAWKGSQGSLTKAFRMSSGYKPRSSNGTGGGGGSGPGSDKNSVYSSTSPTPSFSSSEGGIYATVGSLQTHPAFFHQHHHHHHHLPPPTSAPPPVPGPGIRTSDPLGAVQERAAAANNRVSAPPMDSGHATLPKYAQHRRVKSISDIEIPAVGPIG
ncbi:kazrin-A isoform X4 [Anopheles darlingi]|uniref:kazrin-A isoform X4 n=1 Tax=Anopheles darlingi TaxID=43151 RepID=UPI002100275C|nr:kazrin-A isoform X4 [Anopheles darlingi]